MRMKVVLLTVVGLLFMTSCSTVEKKLSDDELKSIDKVGLVALLPESYNVHYVGLTIFNNAYNTFQIQDANPNEIAADTASKLIKEKGIGVINLKGSGGLIGKLYRNTYSMPNKDRIKKDIESLGRSAGVNYVVVIYSNPVQDKIERSSEYQSAVGLFKRLSRPAKVYSSIGVDLVKINPLEVVSSGNYFYANKLEQGVWRDDYGDSHDGPIQLSQEDQSKMATLFTRAISESVRYSLWYARLIL